MGLVQGERSGRRPPAGTAGKRAKPASAARSAAGPAARTAPLQALKAKKSCLLDCEYGMVNIAGGVMAKQSLVFSVKMMIAPHNRHPL